MNALHTTEGKLEASEIRYRRLFETAQDGILILDADTRKITDANPFIAHLLGYEREELLGKELWEIGLLKDEQSSRTAFERLQKKGFIRYEDLPLRTKSGEIREVEFVSNVYEEDGGKVIQCNIRDVSERKVMQEAKYFLAAVVESSEDSIITVDKAGVITTWNKAAEKIYGYPANEALGKPLSMLAIAEAKSLQNSFDRIMSGQPVARFEVERIRKSGRHIFLSIQLSPVKDSSGNIIAISTVSRDITEAKKATETQSFLAAIVESTDDSIITVDFEGKITTWNRTAEQVYGYTAKETIGQSITILNLPQDKQASLAHVLKAGSGGHVPRYEETRIRKDGSHVEVSVQISPVKDAGGKVIGVATISRDITGRKRADQELERARKQISEHADHLGRTVAERTRNLEEKTKQMEGFCYTVAHDLRAPLRAISGYAEFLRQDCENALGQNGQNYINQIQAATKRLDALIQDLLGYSRIEQIGLIREPVDLEKVVDAALKQLDETIAAKHSEVEVQRPLPNVPGDATTLQHIFLNLISNAVKFSREGVRPRIKISSEDKGDHVRVWVEDNGIGIPPQHQGKIFGMFERLHDTSRYSGTGVGLAIVSKAVERLGGSTGVESEPNVGSKFWIELPRHPRA